MTESFADKIAKAGFVITSRYPFQVTLLHDKCNKFYKVYEDDLATFIEKHPKECQGIEVREEPIEVSIPTQIITKLSIHRISIYQGDNSLDQYINYAMDAIEKAKPITYKITPQTKKRLEKCMHRDESLEDTIIRLLKEAGYL